jgi:glycosyltransferase involved in cell wall biosynthesis
VASKANQKQSEPAPSSSKRASAKRASSASQLSVVIPVYNEEAILERQLRTLVDELRSLKRPFEVLVCANGCRDQTVPIAQELMRGELPEIAVLEIPDPNYGAALRLGIEAARGKIVCCDEIDLCDVDFHRRALRRLDHNECEMVIGSKAMPGSRDRRPITRRIATQVINSMLRVSLGFRGTDTHGLKAFLREPLLPIVQACVVDKNLFASELVIRAGRAGLRIHEIPIELEEQRSPPINLFRRVPGVARDLSKLVAAVRFGKKP